MPGHRSGCACRSDRFRAGSPVRDRAQLALLARFEACLGPPLRLRREVPLPIDGDRRAWDGMVEGDGAPLRRGRIEHPRRAGVERKLRLRIRDDPRASLVCSWRPERPQPAGQRAPRGDARPAADGRRSILRAFVRIDAPASGIVLSSLRAALRGALPRPSPGGLVATGRSCHAMRFARSVRGVVPPENRGRCGVRRRREAAAARESRRPARWPAGEDLDRAPARLRGRCADQGIS